MTQTPQPQPVSGEEVGRFVLKDLVQAHHQARQGLEAPALMSAEHKSRLINSLSEPADIAAYNQYRYVHEYLSRAALLFQLEQERAESSYWQVFSILSLMKMAEAENAHVLTQRPRIMTRQQYEQSGRLFENEPQYGLGAALIETKSLSNPRALTGKKGRYEEIIPPTRAEFMAENILGSYRKFLAATLDIFRWSIRECWVIKTAIELVGRRIGVPELKMMLNEVPSHLVEQINTLFEPLPGLIIRRGLSPQERPENELKAELEKFFQPIDPKSLKPSASALKQARKIAGFDTAQGRSEELYEILRRREDEQ